MDGTLICNGGGFTFWQRCWWRPSRQVDKEDVKVVITGRHGGRLKSWLYKRWLRILGFKNLDVVVMNPLKNYDPEYLAAWKACALLDLKIREYVDADAAFNEKVARLFHGRCLTPDQTKSKQERKAGGAVKYQPKTVQSGLCSTTCEKSGW